MSSSLLISTCITNVIFQLLYLWFLKVKLQNFDSRAHRPNIKYAVVMSLVHLIYLKSFSSECLHMCLDCIKRRLIIAETDIRPQIKGVMSALNLTAKLLIDYFIVSRLHFRGYRVDARYQNTLPA